MFIGMMIKFNRTKVPMISLSSWCNKKIPVIRSNQILKNV